MKLGSEKRKSVRATVARILGHKYFFYFVVAVCVLQVIWYALSYAPSIFDEGYHIGVIELYSNQFSPIINNQGSSWDYLGAVSRSSSYLYHYLLSYPLRIVQLFTDNQVAQVMVLRAINVGIFVTGLILFRRIFIKYTKVHRSVIHVTLLFFVMTPVVAPLVGAVNYDNFVFLLFAIALMLALRIIKELTIKDIIWLIIVGLAGSLVKFYFLGLFVPLLLFIGYTLFRKDGIKTLRILKKQLLKTSWLFKIATATALLLLMGLFIERPVTNFVRYGAFEPRCEQVLAKDRCTSNYTSARNMKALENKDPNFKPKNFADYSVRVWSPIIVRTQVNILYWKKALPVIKILYLLFALTTVGLMVTYIRYILRNSTYRLFLVLIISYTLVLLLYLYKSYVTYAEPVAISSRYLIPIMPLFLFFSAHLTTKFLKNYPKILMAAFTITCLLFLQGGGMTSFIINYDETLFWQNSTVKEINQNTQEVLGRFIINND